MKSAIVFLLCLIRTIDAATAASERPVYITTEDGSNAACGDSYFTDSYGVINSPNYPDFYYDDLYCDYYVSAPTGSSLSFIFKSFHVESSDFVTISCGSSNFPPQEYSGHSLPEALSIPECSYGRVNFRTNNAGVSSGFSLEYYVSTSGCDNTAYTGPNGFVNSAHWPDFYRYNHNCSNVIWASEQSTIRLDFRSFNLQSNCTADWLEISCRDNSDYGPTRHCGSYAPFNVNITQCSQVLLWFHSDSSCNYQGFNIEYTIYRSGAAVCGNPSYFGPSGIISSPNYPGNYSNFLHCDYTIYASTGNSLVLVFLSLRTQSNFDIVTISCPANSSFEAEQYSGDYSRLGAGAEFIPLCSQGLVNFHTDASVVSSGFSLNYFVNVGDCGTSVFAGISGFVTSPSWPSNYGYDQNCYKHIYGDYGYGEAFNLNFQTFMLQDCCDCDWLEVSCLDNSDHSPTRYCGYIDTFETYINNCTDLLLWFHSDGSSNDQGFNIEYTVYQTTRPDSDKDSHSRKLSAADGKSKKEKLSGAENKSSDGKQNAAAESKPINGKPIAEMESGKAK